MAAKVGIFGSIIGNFTTRIEKKLFLHHIKTSCFTMKFLHRLFIFTVSVLLFETLQAQSQKSLAGLMQQRDEYYFRLEVQDTSEIQAINALCSVDATNGISVVCYANQAQYDNLLAAGYQPTLLTPPSLRETAEMYDPQRRRAGRDPRDLWLPRLGHQRQNLHFPRLGNAFNKQPPQDFGRAHQQWPA